MRSVVIVSLAVALLPACSKTLSKEQALSMMHNPPDLECTALVAGLARNSAGVEFYKDDLNGCAKKLTDAGFLSVGQCDRVTTSSIGTIKVAMPTCTASLKKGAKLDATSNTLVFPCGQTQYLVQSVTTEGRHATVQYGFGSKQTLLDGDSCASLQYPHGGSFTVTLNDDGNWIPDRSN